MHDIIIIGSGPAGLSAALSANRAGLDYVTLERGVIGDTIYHFPIAKTLFSTADELAIEEGDFSPKYKPTREQLLDHYVSVVTRNELNVITGVEVVGIEPGPDSFVVISTSGDYRCRAVLVASGGFGKQRRLGVPGETLEMVSYRFSDAYPYALKDILIVGGGNSAAEAALWLAEVGARVSLAVRRGSLYPKPGDGDPDLDRAQIKPWVSQPLDAAIDEGRISLFTSARIIEIRDRSAVLQFRPTGKRGPVETNELSCDHVFALIGADPDTRLLEEAGAVIAADGRPVYNPLTYETGVAGLFVAGHITRERHVKNAIITGRTVIDHLRTQIVAGCPA
jgi:thioredoxin reductase (NADPH)